MQSLNEINRAIYQIVQALEECENDEAREILQSQLIETAEERNLLYIDTIAEMDAQIAKYDLEIERIQKLKKRAQDTKERVKSVLFTWVQSKGGKVESETHKLSIRKNPESIQIDNEQMIIDKLPVAEPKYIISKTKLKEYLINGQVIVDGVVCAHAEQSESLVIKQQLGDGFLSGYLALITLKPVMRASVKLTSYKPIIA